MELDNTRPIWLQLTDEFTRRIAIGEWLPGNKVPSVRELALELKVNPNTVQRALSELDRAGLTGSERTAGRFVLADQADALGAKDSMASQIVDAYIAGVKDLGLDEDTAVHLVRKRWTTKENDGSH